MFRVNGRKASIDVLKDTVDLNLSANGLETNPESDNVYNICSLLKLWLRQLPDPLFPHSVYGRLLNVPGTSIIQNINFRYFSKGRKNRRSRIYHWFSP